MELNTLPAQHKRKKTEAETFKEVIPTRFEEGYKRRPDETKRQRESEN
jgi:hypothetical protein